MTTYSRSRDGRRLALAGTAGTLAALSSIGLLATSAWLISRSAQHPPVLYLMVPVAAVQAFGIGRGFFRYTERLAGHDAALRMLARMRMSAYDRLERLAPAGTAAFRSGDLISRLVSDIDSLTDRWLRVRLPYAVALATGVVTVAVLAALQPAVGLVLALSLAAAALAAPLLANVISYQAERRLAPLRGELAAATSDLLNGAGELSVFSSGAGALRDATAAGAAVSRMQAKSAYARGLGTAVSTLAAGAALWLCLAFGVEGVRSGAVPGVALAVLALTPLAAHELFSGLGPAAQEIPRLRSSAARVREVLNRPDPVREPASPAPRPTAPYDIRVSGLTARWEPGGPDVLRGADLWLPAGQRVAVTGPSGSGKTTLAMVLLRFLGPAAGKVTLAGTDITELDSAAVRSVIGLCEQDAHIFDSTLRENLRLARPAATDAELRDALRRARLSDWADSLPAGLNTPVGEHGAQLSGGQRQRLALARVLLADFPVVILDEPAEHLDEETADALTADLLTATAGRTVLLITHRPVPAGQVDQVLRLTGGRLTPADRAAGPAPEANRRLSGRGSCPVEVVRDVVGPLPDGGPVPEVSGYAVMRDDRGVLHGAERRRVDLAREYPVAADRESLPDPGDIGAVPFHRMDELAGSGADRAGREQPDGASRQLVVELDREVPGRSEPVARVNGAAENHRIVIRSGIDDRGRDQIDFDLPVGQRQSDEAGNLGRRTVLGSCGYQH
jgi:thiol reductant ABC exporter CydC subunit